MFGVSQQAARLSFGTPVFWKHDQLGACQREGGVLEDLSFICASEGLNVARLLGCFSPACLIGHDEMCRQMHKYDVERKKARHRRRCFGLSPELWAECTGMCMCVCVFTSSLEHLDVRPHVGQFTIGIGADCCSDLLQYQAIGGPPVTLVHFAKGC